KASYSGDIAKLLAFGQRAELLEALVLDLADALARDVERATDLVERPWMLTVQPVAQLEHLALALGELRKDLLERLLAERDLGGLLRERHGLVGDEVPELRLLLVSHRLLERDGRLRGAADLVDLVGREVEVTRNLRGQRLTAELGAELALGAHDLVQLLDDVH